VGVPRVRSHVPVGSFLIGTLATVATACSGPASATDPAGPGADRVARLWWGMFAVSAIVFLIVIGLLLWGVFRRRPSGSDAPVVDDRGGLGWVIGGGIVLPIVAILVLFIVTLLTLRAQADEGTNAAASGISLDVVGHRWWWQVSYPSEGFATANEIHIPVGVPVTVNVSTADVIHSFWIPRLQRKVDAVPGMTNQIVLQSDEAGVFRGECAEFCGLQHAHMDLEVVAETQTQYQAWVTTQRTTPPVPARGAAFRGMELFLGSDCSYCHTVRDTNANGTIGPDLTHVASRLTLGAGIIPNSLGHLEGWFLDPQAIKPGVLMPSTRLSAADARALAAYLETLR
jgi:cytochrome c oxidase subunit II